VTAKTFPVLNFDYHFPSGTWKQNDMLTLEFNKQKPVDNQNQVYDMTINMESTFTKTIVSIVGI
jgi:hypothetical protein